MSSKTLTLLESLTGAQGLVEASNALAGSFLQELEESVATGNDDVEFFMALDVSEIIGIMILSDQNVTFETNDGAAPNETINLLAGVPYVWHENSYFANLLATDWVSVFISNQSGETATVQVLALVDATP